VLAPRGVAARGPKEEIFRHPPTLEVAPSHGCKNFSRAHRTVGGQSKRSIGGCTLHVSKSSQSRPSTSRFARTMFACARPEPHRKPRQYLSLLARRDDRDAFPRHTRPANRRPALGVKAEAGAPASPPIFTSRRKSSNRNGKRSAISHNPGGSNLLRSVILLPD